MFLQVTPRKKFKCGSCSSGDLSATEAHMLERSQCVNYFSEVGEKEAEVWVEGVG